MLSVPERPFSGLMKVLVGFEVSDTVPWLRCV